MGAGHTRYHSPSSVVGIVSSERSWAVRECIIASAVMAGGGGGSGGGGKVLL